MERPVDEERMTDQTQLEFESMNYVLSTSRILNNGVNDSSSSVSKAKRRSTTQLSTHEMKPTTYWETLTHMVKGNIGCGLLATGAAFKNGGLLFSGIMVFILGSISCYNQHILVMMTNEIKQQNNYRVVGLAETIGISFENGPSLFRKSASHIKLCIKIFIVITQLGFCCVYFMFISRSLNQICASHGIFIDVHILMILILPIIWATALIRELKYIAPISTIANLSTFAALGLILYNITQDLHPISERKLIGNWDQLPLCFGTVIYSLEGISLTLPLQQSMKKKDRFLGPTGVLNLSLLFVTMLIFIIGFLGYWKYGEGVSESLTYNLDVKDNIITQSVIFCMLFGILCSYALQFYVPIRILLPAVQRWSSSWPNHEFHLYEYILRSVLVLVTFVFAELIPHLDLFVSLVGAIGGTFLALVCSPLADISSRKKAEYGLLKWRIILDITSILIGVCGFFIGTTTSLREIVYTIQRDFHRSEI